MESSPSVLLSKHQAEQVCFGGWPHCGDLPNNRSRCPAHDLGNSHLADDGPPPTLRRS